ncbi:MAG: prepilin-type N-terminal cleavage/methylation domain-containing protein [bacterium]|nr:prepilin-type N-terminal cleavage/methylation domain-containing protein [bacterium]
MARDCRALRARNDKNGFTLIEVMVAVAVFLIFSIGVYGAINMIFKIVYQSRMTILETAILSEEIETVRNLPYAEVGILNGLPVGVLEHEKTVMRNGKNFTVITTVRNIDNPFDGTLGGTPNDTAPADYKLVEFSAICVDCMQQKPVILNTIIAPKGLEGASQNGAIFISVYDYDGDSVSGASVHIVNSTIVPSLIIDDVTDNDGMLRVIDTPTGTLSYNITVTKNGFSSDWTTSGVPGTPTKAPITVEEQTISDMSFYIDVLGNLTVTTIGSSCSVIPNIQLTMRGEKLLGTNPDTYKYNQNFSTNGAGIKDFGDMEYDKYHINLVGTTYDIAGSVPILPVNMTPGLEQEVSVVLRAHTSNSLLVKVLDAGTKLPLSAATVRLYKTSYDESIATGLGYSRQTEWDGGSGQIDMIVDNEYFADSGTMDVSGSGDDIKLKKVGGNYLTSGWVESSTFDLGEPVNFSNIIWEPLSQPVETGADPIKFQIAVAASSTPASWDFVGPDGTGSTFFTSASTVINSAQDDNRYFRYKAFLSTADDGYSPTLSEVAFTYTNSCTPPGQSFFSGLSADTYTLDVSRTGYIATSGPIDISGNNEAIVELSVNE